MSTDRPGGRVAVITGACSGIGEATVLSESGVRAVSVLTRRRTARR